MSLCRLGLLPEESMSKPSSAPSPESGFPLDHEDHWVYRFGAVEVDFRAGELRKSGVRIKIQEQPLQVLSILLRQPGEVVTREEFRNLLWPADTFVDFDHGLNSAVKRLRDALDDDSESPRLIETIPRHGYRFIAPLAKIPRVAGDGSRSLANGRQSISPATGIKRFWRNPREPGFLAFSVGVIAVALLCAGIYRAQVQSVRRHPKVTLAVLPFHDLSGSPGQSFVAEAITQELITDLGKIDPEHIGVSAKIPVEQNRWAGVPVSVIGKQLGVEYVLEGSTRVQGVHVRIAVQLIRVSDQAYVWTEAYDSTLGEGFATQTEIAGNVARAVRDQLLH